ncbi:heme exporter protein CcmB [Martelella sp. HB161492]|uniref:heme exporter protein CcmB n=1 Tax=Martelella sp. HB161492 TaxID=2720726 RepID=UPI00159292D3|nr:heme exporter protein CcmB [Martelella sp. HB161492]
MLALYLRDVKIAMRAGGSALTGLVFYLAVVAVIPFGIGPDLALLARIGPAIIWIGALLSTLIGLERLFKGDFEDGSLDLLLMSDRPLVAVVLSKCMAHWSVNVLPLVVLSPAMGLMLNMTPLAIGAAVLTLLAGSPAMTFIGATGAAIAVSLPRGGLLVPVLVLPLSIPVLIFGVGATYAAVTEPQPFLPPFLILVAITMILAVVGTAASALALRQGGE